MNNNYLDINKASWNARTALHVDSEFYDMKNFMQGKSSLKEIELDLLGDVSGKTILHLQCHFGQDSLSLQRMGADVTGVDLSDKAIDKARSLAEELDLEATFICCDVYSLPKHLDKQFDVVFTSYGTIGWLPDLDRWAGIVSKHLKPGGQFIIAEFHPVLWMFDDDVEQVAYNYFNDGPIQEVQKGTYADPSAPVDIEYVSWNHSLAEVMTSLLGQGLSIEKFQEFNYSPYGIFKNGVEVSLGKFHVKHHGDKLPLVYAIKAIKK